MLLRSMVKVEVRVRFRVWLVSGYAHVFVLLSVVITPYSMELRLSDLSYSHFRQSLKIFWGAVRP